MHTWTRLPPLPPGKQGGLRGLASIGCVSIITGFTICTKLWTIFIGAGNSEKHPSKNSGRKRHSTPTACGRLDRPISIDIPRLRRERFLRISCVWETIEKIDTPLKHNAHQTKSVQTLVYVVKNDGWYPCVHPSFFLLSFRWFNYFLDTGPLFPYIRIGIVTVFCTIYMA